MQLFRWLLLVSGAVVLLATAGQGNQPQKVEKPDLIVSDLTLEGTDFVLEVQNQGPGTAKKGTTVEASVSSSKRVKAKDKATGKDTFVMQTVSVPVTVTVPVEVMATAQVKIPLEKFGVKELAELSAMFTVNLDTKNALDEERKNNNTYYRQLNFSGREITPPRGDYKKSTELPDLVITDITQKDGYLVVHYTNVGEGSTGADFLISIKSGNKTFGGNPYYRWRVPAPNANSKTGGFTLGLIGLKPDDEAEVEATIDPENRVRETDKKNNTFKKKITIK
jgi:hypothetical protein